MSTSESVAVSLTEAELGIHTVDYDDFIAFVYGGLRDLIHPRYGLKFYFGWEIDL